LHRRLARSLPLRAFIDDTAFGFVNIRGNDIWLHAVLAALVYAGFAARDTTAHGHV